MLVKIGEVATQYEVTNRTLRYWEDAGLLTSIRMENGYRYYDEQTLVKIQQILMLRKLKVSIADITKIFSAHHLKTAVNILQYHLETIQLEVSELSGLMDMVNQLIEQLVGQIGDANKALVSDNLANKDLQDDNSQRLEMSTFFSNALQNVLSERKFNMMNQSLGDVRIVQLPKMVFACYQAESATPEEDCWKVLNQFVVENGLLEQYGFRHFGFNNPDPSENNPVYGYEMWVTIPQDLVVPAPLYRKEFPGGLFGAVPTYMTVIGERWGALWQWAMNNEKYTVDWDLETGRRWLEECIDYQHFNNPSVGPDEKQLDLLVPIKLK